MVADLEIHRTDVLRFELASRAGAESLSRRLRARWLEWMEKPDHGWVVAVELRPEIGDLSFLLREVQCWLAERGLRELRYELDGRSYLMRPMHAPAAGA